MGLKAYKGFNQDLKCRGFQYEIGKTYEHPGEINLCGSGFHACPSPLNVFDYYGPATSRYCEVEQDGETIDGDDKRVSSKLTILAEIGLIGLVKAHVEWVKEFANGGTESKTGYRSAATNTDYRSTATNTGNWSAATNTGGLCAATNTGYLSAATNTGDLSAATNIGDRSTATNTGNWSAAANTGNWSAATNTGDRSAATNTGDRSAATNTGHQSAASVEGEQSVAIAIGHASKAKASKGSWITLAERNDDDEIVAMRCGQAGKDIKPDTYYRLEGGEFVEA